MSAPPAPPLWPLALAVGGTVGYHLFQKSVPGDAAPFVVVGVAYLAGLVGCVAAVLATGAPVVETARAAWRPAVGIGVSALVIEVGVLLAYRAGWPLSTASLVSNVAVAVVLLAVGLVAFGEALSGRQWAGVALCALGLALLTAR